MHISRSVHAFGVFASQSLLAGQSTPACITWPQRPFLSHVWSKYLMQHAGICILTDGMLSTDRFKAKRFPCVSRETGAQALRSSQFTGHISNPADRRLDNIANRPPHRHRIAPNRHRPALLYRTSPERYVLSYAGGVHILVDVPSRTFSCYSRRGINKQGEKREE